MEEKEVQVGQEYVAIHTGETVLVLEVKAGYARVENEDGRRYVVHCSNLR